MSRRSISDVTPGDGDEEALGGGVPYLADDGDDDKDDVMVPDKAKSIMSAWLAQHQPRPVPGVTDSLSNSPGARSASQLASGHPVTSTTEGVRDWNQQITPRPLAMLRTLSGPETALGSSIRQHQGKAVLGLQDQSAAANPSLCSQLGPRAPSHNPHMSASIADHCAPSGHGQSGATPARPSGPAAYHVTYEVYGQRSAPSVMPSRGAPGE